MLNHSILTFVQCSIECFGNSFDQSYCLTFNFSVRIYRSIVREGTTLIWPLPQVGKLEEDFLIQCLFPFLYYFLLLSPLILATVIVVCLSILSKVHQCVALQLMPTFCVVHCVMTSTIAFFATVRYLQAYSSHYTSLNVIQFCCAYRPRSIEHNLVNVRSHAMREY